MPTRRTALALTAAAAVAPLPARAASAAEIDAKVDIALNALLAQSPAAQALAARAVAVLVFPEVVKAGFGFGGQYGQGALRRGGATVGYYNITAASFGLQIGAQAFAETYFFMTEEALGYLTRSQGWEVGADAKIAVADQGYSADATSTTVTQPIVVFVSGQTGLMAGVSVEGSKISRIHPK
jgi:lipid-binding SYLF domain-containing protein